MLTSPIACPTNHPASGQLVATDGRPLPLLSTRLVVTAGGGLARTRLLQRFANPHQEPLTVTYQLPLPADGAVAAFAFQIGERRVEGEIDGRQKARERFEQALAGGHTASLLEQDRTSLFQQVIGNIPPGAEVEAELTVDQPLSFLPGGEWEYRFPTTVAPRYLGAEGRVPDAGRVQVDVAGDPLAVRLGLELAIADLLVANTAPTSASHALRHEGGATTHVALLADAGVRLDRDVVVRWRVGAAKVGAELITARPEAAAPHGDSAYGLLTLVPPSQTPRVMARDLTVLLDTSGSMGGAPLQHAKAVLSALIESLTGADRLQLIEFSDAPRRWQKHPTLMNDKARQQALRWLHALQVGGCTEMHSAVLESLRTLRDEAQSQVVLVSDGLIGFEQEIVQTLLSKLPRNCRFHMVGVGSAANRSLTAACARAGRGVEVFAGLDEVAAVATARLVASMHAPVVVDLQLTGTALLGVAPVQLPDLFAGAPARLSLRLRPEGGTLQIRGATADGAFVRELQVPATALASGRPEVITRFGREQVEDLEMQVAAGNETAECERQIEALGLQFRLATRFTSWIAVSHEPTVDPQAPVRKERMPHELPYGMSVEGLGLRQAMAAYPAAVCKSMLREEADVVYDMARTAMPQPPAAPRGHGIRDLFRLKSAKERQVPWQSTPQPTLSIATLVLHTVDQLRFELAPAIADWQLPVTVRVRWHDGTVLALRVVPERSTRSGLIAPGATICLHLELPAGAPEDAPAILELDGDLLFTIVLPAS